MAKRKPKDIESSERIKLILEVIGILSAILVAYFAYQAYRLQKLSTRAEIVLIEVSRPELDNSYHTETYSTGEEKQIPVVSCRYAIKLANNGGEDTFIRSVTYDIRFGKASTVLDFDEKKAVGKNIESGTDFLFIGKFTEWPSEPLRLPAHSPQTLDITLEIEYPKENYDVEHAHLLIPELLSTYDTSKVTVVEYDITIHFPDKPPLAIKDIDCVAFARK